MESIGTATGEYHIFRGYIPCRYSGQCGFAVRIIPYHNDLVDKYDTGLIRWDEEAAADPQKVKVPE